VSNHRFDVIQRVGNIKTGKIEKIVKTTDHGLFCNNDGKTYVSDLKECPMTIPIELRRSNELSWMKKKVRD
jgi:hypothetical protein